MIVAHITANTGHTTNRNTEDVWPETVKHFKPFQIREGHIEQDIDRTPLTCRLTVNSGVAVFDMLYGERALFTNICCLKPEANIQALELASQTASKMKLKPVQPKLPLWLCTFMLDTSGVAPDILSLCGEIEFYIYDALRRKA